MSATTKTGVQLTLTAEELEAVGGEDLVLADWLETVLRGIAALRSGEPLEDVPAERLLQESSALIDRLEGVRTAALREHVANGGFVRESGIAMGVAKGTAQTRRDVLRQGRRAPELWARRLHGEVDHPGTPVPDALRSWDVPWLGYMPVDITPPDLWASGLALGYAADWAEPLVSPDDLTPREWLDRSAAAVVPFDLDHRFWPLNPAGRTGRTGRNLGRWGENAAADAVVVSADGYVLLIRRADRGVWAFPGGMVEPGEAPAAAMRRELREESGAVLADDVDPVVLHAGHVADWRETDHAWVCTTAGLFRVPERLPVTADTDATEARWFRLDTVEQLAAELEPIGGLYEAHRPVLVEAAKHLDYVATMYGG